MKKIIFTTLLFGLSMSVFAQTDPIYDTITIPYPKYTDPIDVKTKNLYVEQNTTLDNVKENGIQEEQVIDPTIEDMYDNTKLYYVPQKIESNIYHPVIDMLGKFKNEIKVIYSDFDGIIIPENYNQVVLKNSIYKTFKKLSSEKIPFVIVTGRTYREAKRLANELELSPDYYITQNGAEIINSKDELEYENYIGVKDLKKINSEVKWFNYYYEQDLKIAFYQFGDVYTYRKSNIPGLVDTPIEIDAFSQFPKLDGVSKVKIYAKDPKTLNIFKRYMKKYYAKSLNIDSVTNNMLDITNKTATKGNAVKILSEKLNIDLSNSAAFGYAENDISLIKLIRDNGGLAVSTEDSNQKVKILSSYITKDLENDGFSFAVDTILGNNLILNAETEKAE